MSEELKIKEGYPALVVEYIGDEEYQYLLSDHVQPSFQPISLYSILVSDLIDHIVAHYHEDTGQPIDILHKRFIKHLKKEIELKKSDPDRGNLKSMAIRNIH